MNQLISWNDLYTLLGVLIMVVTGVWRANAAVSSIEKKAAEDNAILQKEIAAFKIDVANRYVTVDAIRQWKDDLTQAINRLGDRLDRLVEKAG